MAKNRKTPDMNLPVWFDGQNINEALFCEEFLQESRIIFANRAFFTPNGRVTDDIVLRGEVYEKLKSYTISSVPQKIKNIMELLKLEAMVEDLPPQPDRIHVANGTLMLDGRFIEGKKEIVQSRLPVSYNPNAAAPALWLNFLDGLLYEEDIPTLQEFIGYCLIPSNKGQRMMVIKGNGGEGKSQIGAVLSAIFGTNMKDGSIGKISENRFARADLEHILLCVDDDMRMEALRQTNYVKSIVTAQGKMDLERKGKQSYQGWMFARLLAFSNGDLQALYDRSDGFYRRQLVLTTKEKPVDRADDPDLAEKMKAEAEGIFLWAFEGLQRLVANNFKFTESDRIRENREGGYMVYRIRETAFGGGTKLSAEDGFLQFMIERLLASNAPLLEECEDEDLEEVGDEMKLTSLQSITDFMICAGRTLPDNIRLWARRNLAVARSHEVSPEERRHAQRALSIMMNIQWKSNYFEAIDPVAARRILDEELYGMERVKQRIMETIIQINRTHTLPAYGLLLVGPAGTGKSQIAYAVARILRLPWTTLDMSSINDPEQLTGSSRVYANAKPGIIMEAFSVSGESNLVFIINELDKAASGKGNGNPADVLLTLLDNLGFTDNYMECMIPTTGVYPIATANNKEQISAPLMSRFAVIDIPDYTPDEKKIIFSKFALPKILKRMSLKENECKMTDEALDAVIELFSNTSGIRDLEQAAEHIAANALYQIEVNRVSEVVFTAEMVRSLLRD